MRRTGSGSARSTGWCCATTTVYSSGRLRRGGWAAGTGLSWPYRAPDGALWIVAGERLYRVEDDRLVLVHRLPGQLHMTSMLQDRHGDLWLGTENQGLLRISGHGLERL